MSRRCRVVLAAGLGLLLLAGCGDRDEIADEVRGYIENTREDAYRFAYSEQLINTVEFTELASGQPTTGPVTTNRDVTGVALDDFRTAARLTIDGTAIRDEIITDDLLAVRYLVGSAVVSDVDKAALAEVDTETSIEDVSVIDVLESSRWVIDPVGAPALSNARSLRNLGSDPLFDAFTILDYVEQAIDQASGVRQYQEGAISQAYRSSEDSFSLPDEGTGVERFDLIRPKFPNGADLASGERSAVAEARHFRKMAIYVRDGKVIEIQEDLAPRGTQLRESLDYVADAAEAAGQDTVLVDAARAEVATASPDEAVQLVMSVVNFVAAVSGGDEIQPRVMKFTVLEAEGEAITVDVPEGDDVVEGNLAVLVNRGVKPAGLEASTDDGVSDPTVVDVGGDGSATDGAAVEGDGGADSGADGGAAGTSPAGEDAPTDDTGAGPPGDPDAAPDPNSP